MKKTIMLLSVLLFIGCGGAGNSNNNPENPDGLGDQNNPTSSNGAGGQTDTGVVFGNNNDTYDINYILLYPHFWPLYKDGVLTELNFSPYLYEDIEFEGNLYNGLLTQEQNFVKLEAEKRTYHYIDNAGIIKAFEPGKWFSSQDVTCTNTGYQGDYKAMAKVGEVDARFFYNCSNGSNAFIDVRLEAVDAHTVELVLNYNDNHTTRSRYHTDIEHIAIRNSRWKNLLKEAEIEYRTIYQMRHSFATVMIEHGEDILWVSHMLGHSDTAMTLQMYAKYRKQKDRKRAMFLQGML